ncbi:MAG: hypothetical protein U0736_17590 [Gemmataceae bacterium]
MTGPSRICLLYGLLLLAGCSSSTAPLASVQGQVRFRGRPVAGGTIVFTPDEQRGGRGPIACARLDDDGRFRLTSDGRQGAVAGWHRITVAGTGAFHLPGELLDPELSGQRFEVRSDQPNLCNLELE